MAGFGLKIACFLMHSYKSCRHVDIIFMYKLLVLYSSIPLVIG